MRERKIRKLYLAIVQGAIEKEELWSDELSRDAESKKTFVEKGTKNESSKAALTRIKPLIGNGVSTLILADIETGRTHQIRAQAAVRGHPLLGDRKYGGADLRGGFLLHAWRMEFPVGSSDYLAALPPFIEAPLPENFQRKIFQLFGKSFSPEMASGRIFRCNI